MFKNRIKILLADDHPFMLKGLKQELSEAGYQIVAEATNGAKAIDLLMKHRPDVAFLDIEMPLLNGFEVVKRGLAEKLPTRFIVMTYHKEKGFVVQAKKVGAQGYLLKEDSFEEIEKCIKEVLNGNYYYSSSFENNFKNIIEEEFKKIMLLTPSERTILRLIAQGNNSTEIGTILCISPRTIQKHRTNIIAKLELNNEIDSLTSWTIEYKEIIETL